MQQPIRNFAIISHIDHGKSTLADRFLDICGTIPERSKRARFLDQMDLEREKGITIKLKTVRMLISSQRSAASDQQKYILNLIDTPGHVDFSYEVSRALAACEGAILLVDGSQGIQAQTLAVLRQAEELDLVIIPVINKIDLKQVRSRTNIIEMEIRTILGEYKGKVSQISAKTGEGVKQLLTRIIEEIPQPSSTVHRLPSRAPRALIFDSFYDNHKGVIALIRIFDGQINAGDSLYLMAKNQQFQPVELGYLSPNTTKQKTLNSGDVGYIATGLKDLSKVSVGDTITQPKGTTAGAAADITPLPGYHPPKPMVFVSLYPAKDSRFEELQKALSKLQLIDSSLTISLEKTSSLGAGFRVGFLGLLHAEIIVERLKREYQLNLISTTPSVSYQLKMKNGKLIIVSSPSQVPNSSEIKEVREPKVAVKIYSPKQYLGEISRIISQSRGDFVETKYLSETNLLIEAKLPLSELITKLYDQLKSVSSGYASLDYQFAGYEKADLVRLDIFAHGELVEPLSQVVPRDRAYQAGKQLVEKLKAVLPRQQFKVAIQATVGSRVIARATLPAVRKDVTAKLYGGDRTRRDKLLKKQAKGKKRLAQFGKINIPAEKVFELVKG